MWSSVHERSCSPRPRVADGFRPAERVDIALGKAWSRSLFLYFVLAPLIVFVPLVALLLLRASGERTDLVHRARSHAGFISSVFERETVAARNLLKGLAGSPARLNGDLPTFYEQLKRTDLPEGSWLILWDLERQLLNTRQPLGATLPVVTDFPGVGATIERLRTEDFAVSDRVVSRVNGASVVAVHVKTADGEGRPNGALTVSLSESRLSALMNEQPLSPGWVASLFDRTLAHVASSGRTPLFGEGPTPRMELGRLEGRTGEYVPVQADGRYRLFYDRSGSSGFTAVVRVPQSFFDEPFDQAVRQISLSGLALVLASALAASAFARRLSLPVRLLAETATKANDELMFAVARHESFWVHTPESLFTVQVLPGDRFLIAGINPAHEELTGIRSADVEGRDPHDCLPPAVAQAVTARYRECVRRGQPITYEEVLDLPAGRRSWRTNLAPVRDPTTNRVVLLFGSARDVTAELQDRDELTRLNGQLRSILSSVSDCYCTLDRDYRLTAANSAALDWLGLDEGAALGLRLKHMFGPEKPCGSAIIRAMERREIVHEELPSGIRKGRWLSYHIYPSQDGVSVFFRDVTEARASREAIREISRQLLMAQEEERKRIAAELHDSTSQHLVAANLGMARLPPPGSDAEDHLRREIEECLSEALRELRISTYLLHPPGLHRDGISATLRGFVEGFGRRSGLRATLAADPAMDRLPEDLQRALFRIVQEALANTHRHARATSVTVRARLARGMLFVCIRDDGRGIKGTAGRLRDIEEAPVGVGLPGMRARLRQFGGDLAIRSGGTGTTLMAIVPLARDGSGAARAA